MANQKSNQNQEVSSNARESASQEGQKRSVHDHVKSGFRGFVDFIRSQGVVGLAVGFILGGTVSKLVSSFVNDIVYPLLGVVLGSTESLASASVVVSGSEIKYGSFLNVLIDFMVIALVVYFGVKGLGLDKLDKKD